MKKPKKKMIIKGDVKSKKGRLIDFRFNERIETDDEIEYREQ